MSDIEPIHCPHCGPGNSMVEAYQDDYGYWKVGCGACGSHSGTLHPNHKPDARRRVIEIWNRRPDKWGALEEAAAIIEANMLCGADSEVLLPRSNPGNKVGLAYAVAIRALIPSEPHDAEGRE